MTPRTSEALHEVHWLTHDGLIHHLDYKGGNLRMDLRCGGPDELGEATTHPVTCMTCLANGPGRFRMSMAVVAL